MTCSSHCTDAFCQGRKRQPGVSPTAAKSSGKPSLAAADVSVFWPRALWTFIPGQRERETDREQRDRERDRHRETQRNIERQRQRQRERERGVCRSKNSDNASRTH